MIEPRDVDRIKRELAHMLRLAGDEPDSFAVVARQLHAAVDEGLPAAAMACIDQGFSWTDMGRALGVTRSAAHEHYGPTSRRRRSSAPRPIDGQLHLVDQAGV